MSSARLWSGFSLLLVTAILITYGLLSEIKDKPTIERVSDVQAAPPLISPRAPLPPPPSKTDRQRALQRAEIERQLSSISAQYKVPEQLMYKSSAPVVFVLEIEGNGTAAKTLAAVPGLQDTAQVSVSRFVRARLSGAPDMVKITLRGGEAAERQFAQFKNVEWVWDVEGLKTGRVNLNLELLAEIKIDNKSEPLQIKTFQKTLPINISFFDSIKIWTDTAMGLWPFITAIGAMIGSLLAFFGFKKKDAKADA